MQTRPLPSRPVTSFDRLENLGATAPSLEHMTWQVDAELDLALADQWERPDIDGDTLAFLQYTSGSTGTPKGVMLSHENLLHNSLRIMQAFEITRSQFGVFWLRASTHGAHRRHPRAAVWRQVQRHHVAGGFLQKPLRWLQAISHYRATISGGPNFAYELCVAENHSGAAGGARSFELVARLQRAEPVRAETIDAFCEAFAVSGFRREAFYPCYGTGREHAHGDRGMKFEPPVIRSFDAVSIETGAVTTVLDGTSGSRPAGREWA